MYQFDAQFYDILLKWLEDKVSGLSTCINRAAHRTRHFDGWRIRSVMMLVESSTRES